MVANTCSRQLEQTTFSNAIFGGAFRVILKNAIGEECSTESQNSWQNKTLFFNFHLFISALMLFARETDNTPAKYYGACSITYLGAMLASNQALQYVSYPTQVNTLYITICQFLSYLMQVNTAH